ncbi:MAG: hypothetical protein N838_15720 [Thiohalocapsa sp. PB-PSB1]|nr:MAG: hypothetical protein N838_15720 [Thiohalocapsa sp. PB-PSB1]
MSDDDNDKQQKRSRDIRTAAPVQVVMFFGRRCNQ